MARKKQYNEEEVINKAMRLFWKNGYEATSVRMLEKEMGINQFSIYASFKNKQGVFLESIKNYKKEINGIKEILRQSNNGVTGIKQYFYNFLEFSKEGTLRKGCLVTNSVNEIKDDADPEVMVELKKFANEIRTLFVSNLKQDDQRKEIECKADFLMNSLLGLSIASKVFDKDQLENIIEVTFKNL
ncbi:MULTISPECIES: TetR/AcrR family transcriptional regulator [Cellulophaga]|jgi:AcrR family transcriptional regulator|uniref:Transcriptional regulator, TetR family n=2 Tax=Cellulophaga baltica TaxID=76594 RepID=A0A1G7L2N0_9FLAO|nr:MULTISPECIES: TetR/AcrR family transcriptional regulator [Cellulophaga]WFO17674.1 TetR/AcrR family transcriptional regulator [Cellulophaga baltica 4]AIZ41907.1 TetR family transcriptional regulator [Cellulophaga baltica 18]KGK30919.1 TetR family transcriptional regulator [Cellulophaga sp. E6(2014)]MBA6316053.1 TetR/AcrR family transcriptional regulator [Cellulophaga baltica]SDF43269.1 transcriptional regulator, TetR family [Cellulophaga baltica]